MQRQTNQAPKKHKPQHIRLGVDERELLISTIKSEGVDCSKPGATHDDRVWSDCVEAVLKRVEAILL